MCRRPPAVQVLLIALAVLLVTATSTVPGASAGGPHRPQATPDRAMWVWDRPAPRVLVDFARANGVQDLFVWTPVDLTTDAAWLRDVRKRSAAVGIRMHALGAETDWIDDPQAAVTWQRQALDTGFFDGIHLDVEPWLHPGWTGDRQRVVEAYVDLLATLAADTDRPVEADIAFWLDEVTVRGERLDRAVLARVDAVTVMSYRDSAAGIDSITAVAAVALDAARLAGKPIRLAVETRHVGDDPVSEKQTFWGATRRQMAAVMAEVDRAVVGHPTYRGIAVHDYTGWRAMRAR